MMTEKKHLGREKECFPWNYAMNSSGQDTDQPLTIKNVTTIWIFSVKYLQESANQGIMIYDYQQI